MSIKEPKLNINGEFVDFRDIKKIVELLTKTSRSKIDTLKNDMVTIDQQKVTCKKFEELNKKLQSAIEPLVTTDLEKKNVFNEKVVIPVGISTSEFIAYLDVNISPYSAFGGSNITVHPKQLALAEQWQSITFPSKISSVTQPSHGNDPKLFSQGSFDILVQNNAVISAQTFNSKFTNVVGNQNGLFSKGKFFINGYSIEVENNDTLNDISQKINNTKIGVVSDIIQSDGRYALALKSEKIGAENSILIEDSNGVLNHLSEGVNGFFDQFKEYKTVNVNTGDSLEKIAYKINTFEKSTNLHAEIFQVSKGQYALVLKSLAPGIDNAFEIKDNATILDGSSSSNVFKDVFNHKNCVIQKSQNAVLNLNGVNIESTTNNVKNIYDGVEMIMKSATEKPLMFEVRTDVKSIILSIKEFAEKYNALRQAYDADNYDEKNLSKRSELQKNTEISTAFTRIDMALSMIEELNIGLSKGTITVDSVEDGKNVKKDYKNMIKIDELKLFDIVKFEPEKVQKAFELSIDSSSENFIKPLIMKKIGINNQALGSNKIDLDIDIDLDNVTLKSRASIGFQNSNNVVDATGKDKNKFKPGTFWINGSPISIKNGMDLNGIVSAINDASKMSRIGAAVCGTANNKYIKFTQYSGEYAASDDALKFKRINLHDPNNILQDVFSVYIKTSDFDVSSTTAHSKYIDEHKSLNVNGITITPTTNTIEALVNSINDVSDKSGIFASAILNPNTGKYGIRFDSTKLQAISIDNTEGCISSTISIPNTPQQQIGNEFFDTSKAVSSIFKINDRSYNKSCIYSIDGDDVKSSGTISFINNDDSNMKVENLELWFLGNASDKAHISITQGIAANVLSEMDAIFNIRPGYKGSTSNFMEVMSNLDMKKEDMSNIIKSKENELKKKEQSLTYKFSKAISVFDEQDAYDNLAKALMHIKDD